MSIEQTKQIADLMGRVAALEDQVAMLAQRVSEATKEREAPAGQPPKRKRLGRGNDGEAH